MTSAINEKSFDSLDIFIDHNTAFWYVLLVGEPSPEYQWRPADRQIEWEYHQGLIHISCFLLQPILFCCVQFWFALFIFSRSRPFQSFLAFSYCANVLCSSMASGRMCCCYTARTRASRPAAHKKRSLNHAAFHRQSGQSLESLKHLSVPLRFFTGSNATFNKQKDTSSLQCHSALRPVAICDSGCKCKYVFIYPAFLPIRFIPQLTACDEILHMWCCFFHHQLKETLCGLSVSWITGCVSLRSFSLHCFSAWV